MSVARSGFQGDQDLDEQLLRVAEEHSVSILVEQRIVDADLVEVLEDEESLRELVDRIEAVAKLHDYPLVTSYSVFAVPLYDAIVERISVVRRRFVRGTRAISLGVAAAMKRNCPEQQGRWQRARSKNFLRVAK